MHRQCCPIRLVAMALAAGCSGAHCVNGGGNGGSGGAGQIISTSPPDGTTNVGANATIDIVLSQPADPDSLEIAITPETDFTLNWSSDDTIVTIEPSANLVDRGTTHTVAVSAVSFADGSTLETPYSFSFSIVDEPVSVSDKWELWSSGRTRLRGADLHPCRVGTEAGTCVTLISKQDVRNLRNMGANLINASYPGLFEEQPPYGVNATAREYMDNLINWAQEVGIYVVIHVRTGPGRNEPAITGLGGEPLITVWTDQAAHDAWIAMWRYIAERYATHPVVAGYNLMVEPHVNTWADPAGILTPAAFARQFQGTLWDWNTLAGEITAAIREVDTETPIIINSLQWASPSWFEALTPTGDSRTVYSFHAYDPDVYTNQPEESPVSYPSLIGGINLNQSWLVQDFHPALHFSLWHNVPIYVGEFGLFRWALDAATFVSDEIALFEQYGWNYAYYVWRGDEPEFDGFNIEYGTDPGNHVPILRNPLLNAFTAYWSQNVDFPSSD